MEVGGGCGGVNMSSLDVMVVVELLIFLFSMKAFLIQLAFADHICGR
jgi:hypothetical protein